MTARDEVRALLREVHRSWFLSWRIPVSAWHGWRARRLLSVAQWHRDRQLQVAHRALDLAAKYPTIPTEAEQ